MSKWSSDAYKIWVSSAVRDETTVVSLRAVLRVFPLALVSTPTSNGTALAQALQSFRFAFSTWALVFYRGGGRTAHSSARMRYSSGDIVADTAALSVRELRRVSSSRTIVSARVAAVRAVDLASKAAMLSGGAKAATAFWQSIGRDIGALRAGGPIELMNRELWLNDVRGNRGFRVNFPNWIRDPLDAFDQDTNISGSWKIWLHWYRPLLSENPSVRLTGFLQEDVAIHLATRSAEFWEGEPSKVVSRIAQIVGLESKADDGQTIKRFILDLLESQGRAFSIDEIEQAFRDAQYQLTRPSIRGRLNSLTYDGQIKRIARATYASINFNASIAEIEPVPAQGPGPHFRANEDGIVDRAFSSEVDARGNNITLIDQLRPLGLRYGRELQARLSRNEFPELLDATESYLAALDPRDDRQIEWGEVWGLGVVLQNAAASAQRRIENRTLPELEDPAKTALDSLLMIHGPMILASQEGAKLSDIASQFLMTREEQQVVGEAAKRIAEQLGESPSIITKRAAASVHEAAGAIGEGPHPERGSVYGLATIKNISIVLVGGAAAATPALIGALLGSTIVGAVVGAPLSLLVVEAVKKNPAFSALVTQLGARLETMTDPELRSWMEQRVQRLAPFKSFVSNNREQLTKIAETTPELRWMLKYIAFISKESR